MTKDDIWRVGRAMILSWLTGFKAHGAGSRGKRAGLGKPCKRASLASWSWRSGGGMGQWARWVGGNLFLVVFSPGPGPGPGPSPLSCSLAALAALETLQIATRDRIGFLETSAAN